MGVVMDTVSVEKRPHWSFGIDSREGDLVCMIPTMKRYPRIYCARVEEHLRRCRQTIFLSSPRQVGKTAVAEGVATNYLSWDDDGVRRLM